MTRLTWFTTALVLAATAAACGGGSSDTASVVAPTATVNTETFTGTVAAGGTDGSHTFTVTTAGAVTVTLLSVAPLPSVVVYVGIGNPGSGGTCSLLQAPTLAQGSNTAQIQGTAAAGSYCVSVQDFQGVGPITYTLTVAHT